MQTRICGPAVRAVATGQLRRRLAADRDRDITDRYLELLPEVTHGEDRDLGVQKARALVQANRDKGLVGIIGLTSVAVYADPPDTGGAGEAIKNVEVQLHNVYKVTYDSPSSSPQADHTLELSVTGGGATHTDKRSYQYWQR